MSIAIESILLIGNTLYFLVRGFRVLLAYDIATNMVQPISILPDGDPFDLVDGIKMYLWKDKIVFTPMGTSCIWQYDIANDVWIKRELLVEDKSKLDMQLSVSILYGNKLLWVGCHSGKIICFDLERGEIECRKMDEIICSKMPPFFDRFCYQIVASEFVIPMADGKTEVRIDLGTARINYRIVEKSLEKNPILFGVYFEENKRFQVCSEYCFETENENGGTLSIGGVKHKIDWRTLKEVLFELIDERKIEIPKYLRECRGYCIEEYILYVCQGE